MCAASSKNWPTHLRLPPKCCVARNTEDGHREFHYKGHLVRFDRRTAADTIFRHEQLDQIMAMGDQEFRFGRADHTEESLRDIHLVISPRVNELTMR